MELTSLVWSFILLLFHWHQAYLNQPIVQPYNYELSVHIEVLITQSIESRTQSLLSLSIGDSSLSGGYRAPLATTKPVIITLNWMVPRQIWDLTLSLDSLEFTSSQRKLFPFFPCWD